MKLAFYTSLSFAVGVLELIAATPARMKGEILGKFQCGGLFAESLGKKE